MQEPLGTLYQKLDEILPKAESVFRGKSTHDARVPGSGAGPLASRSWLPGAKAKPWSLSTAARVGAAAGSAIAPAVLHPGMTRVPLVRGRCVNRGMMARKLSVRRSTKAAADRLWKAATAPACAKIPAQVACQARPSKTTASPWLSWPRP